MIKKDFYLLDYPKDNAASDMNIFNIIFIMNKMKHEMLYEMNERDWDF